MNLSASSLISVTGDNLGTVDILDLAMIEGD
jgi:hypothetical protein